MDSKSLQEEYQALLSDKAGEAGYLQSLQLQIAKLMVLRNIHSSFALWHVIQLVLSTLFQKRFRISHLMMKIYLLIFPFHSQLVILLSENFPQYEMFLRRGVQDIRGSLWMKMTRARQVIQLTRWWSFFSINQVYLQITVEIVWEKWGR